VLSAHLGAIYCCFGAVLYGSWEISTIVSLMTIVCAVFLSICSICVNFPVSFRRQMSSPERIKRHCSICNIEESKPVTPLFRCRQHHELRCSSCVSRQKHSFISSSSMPSSSSLSIPLNPNSYEIHSILEHKEVEGSKYINSVSTIHFHTQTKKNRQPRLVA
jgi:hypothetical protein